MNNTKNTEITNDYIDWYEFSPVKDYFLVQTIPNESDKKTETGIITKISESVIEDRPNSGVVKSIGPDCPYAIGEILFFQKSSGYDLNNIRVDDNDNKYKLYHPDAVLGKRVKDVRSE